MPHAQPLVIPQLLADRARQSPDAPAMCIANDSQAWEAIAWRQVHARVQQLAGALQQLGLQPGDRLAIQLGACLEWELLRQATLAVGGVVVGIDPQASAQQTAHMLSVAQPVGLTTTRASLFRWTDAPQARLRFGIHTGSESTHLLAERHANAPHFVAFDALDQFDGVPPCTTVQPDDAATIIFTSGSTGIPKGIEYSHRQIMAACHAIASLYPELEVGDRTVCWLPMSHLYQRMVNLLAIERGMTTYFIADPENLSTHFDAIRPSFFVGVPRLFEKIADEVRAQPEKSESWRRGLKYAVSGSAPIDPATLELLVDHNVLVLEAYGTTENAIPMAASRKGARRFGSVGRPLSENDLQFGQDGEIFVKGPGVFGGYMGVPSADRFTRDGFYATGDYGFIDDQGFLFLSGRKSEFIKTSTGRKIAPAKIEAVYARAPLVEQIVIVGDGRKTLVALVTVRNPHRADLRDELQKQFAELEHELALHERISNFTVLDRPFSVRLGEVTPTLKPRRERIAQVHALVIDAMYNANPAAIETAPRPQRPARVTQKHVLLTGATGVVGSSLIPLLLNDEQTTIYLLIRADSSEHLKDRWRKLLDHLGRSRLSSREMGRLIALRGDVAQPRLGLESQQYNQLAGKLTHIVHAAGNVRLTNDLESARRDAVVPTQRILELARSCLAAGQFQKLEYISTVGVAGRTAGLVAERPYDPPEGYHNTYEAAKCEAEWLVLRQSDAGLPATVHRPSMVVGDSRTGKALSHQVFYHLAEFFVGLRTGGIVPDTRNVKLDIIPCDYVARAIHHSVCNTSTTGKILHLCSGPEASIKISALADGLRPIFAADGRCPPELTKLPLRDFREQLPALRKQVDSRHSSFLKALPLFLDYLDSAQTFDNTQTCLLLADGDIELPSVNSYLGLIMSDFFNATTRSGQRKRIETTENVVHGRVRESC